MKRLLFFLPIVTLFSCSSTSHYHDGKYKASLMLYDVTVTINGSDIQVNNSVTGETKFTCIQYPDRIEYEESNGVTRIITVDQGKNLHFNDKIVFSKVN